MDNKDYNNMNNPNQNFMNQQNQQGLQEDYPSENEIISNQNSNNTPQENYCPPPVPQDFHQPNELGNIYQNPNPQSIYQNSNAQSIYQNPNAQSIYQNPNAQSIYPNPEPQAPYMKPSPPPLNPPSLVPPQIPVGEGVSYQAVNYNQEPVVISVQPQPQYIVQPAVVVHPQIKVSQVNHNDEYARRRRQQQEEDDCLACLQILCIFCYCLALIAGGR